MPLLVTIPLPPAPAGGEYGWDLWSADGSKLRSSGSALPALLPTGDDLTLAVPAEALSWHEVTLPQGSMNGMVRLRSVLNGLLEDRLLDDPELLHFAVAPDATVGKPTWVAACNRIWLRSAVQAFETAGRRVERIVPEFSPRPLSISTTPASASEPTSADAPALIATGEPGNARITLCDAQGVITLPLDAASIASLGTLPTGTQLQAEPAVAALAEELLQRPVPLVLPAERWAQALRSDWDLAQFDLASSGRARAGKKLASIAQMFWRSPRWRAARWGAAVLVLVQLIGVNAWAWKERRALEAKRSAIGNILTQTFPTVKPYEPQVQMAREVAALQQATGGVAVADVEPMLGALAASLPPGRVPSAIDYSTGQLRLRGLGLGMTDVSAVAAALASRGYSARSEGDLLLVQAQQQAGSMR
jgi:general secretion pathway protein L